jgi:hypothetical protein
MLDAIKPAAHRAANIRDAILDTKNLAYAVGDTLVRAHVPIAKKDTE